MFPGTSSYAIRNGGQSENPKVVEALLAAGADPCIRDASGYIPYSTAREGGAVQGMLANAGGYDRACDGAPEIVESDQGMKAAERANLRSGPGTDYDKVGLLEVGEEVRVTGEAGEWLRVEAPNGGEAFVHGSLLAEASAFAETTPAVDLQPLCAGSAEASACWVELANKPGCHFWTNYSVLGRSYVWSGQCTGDVTDGDGRLLMTGNDGSSYDATGAFNFGKQQGHWVVRRARRLFLIVRRPETACVFCHRMARRRSRVSGELDASRTGGACRPGTTATRMGMTILKA